MKEFIEKLIERLKEISVENTCSDCPYKAKCDEVQERINDETTDLCGATIKALSIKIVNELAEEHKGGWIPVEQRLPNYSDTILVCTKNGGRTLAHLRHTPIEWRDMYMNKIDDVIAWKYLDAPYQPKGE